QRMSTLMERASGQRAILRPSDDPVGTGDSLRLRSEQRAAEQHARNTQDGLGWLTVADSAIRTSVDLLVRARDLALQGATGTASQQGTTLLPGTPWKVPSSLKATPASDVPANTERPL